MSRLPALSLSLMLFAGCSSQLDDERFPTGSSTLISSADFSHLYVVDTDGSAVASIDIATNSVETITVGLEPTRIARAGERIFVTLRGERAVAILDDRGGDLTLSGRIDTGAEPIGIVAGESGERIYVASSLSGLISEIDTTTLETLRSWDIESEPRWLALHPSEKSLYVASVRDGLLNQIDLDSGDVTAVDLPEVHGSDFEDLDLITLTPRITGDPAVSPDGKTLAIPVLYVDNISEVDPPDMDGDDDDDFLEVSGGYGGPGQTRFHGGIVTFPVNPGGTIDVDGGSPIEIVGNGADFEVLRSYPSSVVFSPDGETMVVPLEGASAVLSVKTRPNSDPMSNLNRAMQDEIMFMPGISDMNIHLANTAIAPAGPRGIAFTEDERAFVHSFLDRTVTDIQFNGFEPATRFTGVPVPFFGGGDTPVSDDFINGTPVLEEPIVFADEHLPADIAEGRRLFYSTDNTAMAAQGAGVSCATCHFDGRNDGLTWSFEGPGTIERQTPSLAGVVSLTAPLTWTDSVATVLDEVLITSQGRMGGSGLSHARAEKVAAFIDWTREADVPLANSESDAVTRGREIFHRAEVGCADCHNGAAWTDNESYDLFGIEEVRTPSLVGIAATAPYLHNGTADSISTLLRWSVNEAMGDTSSLNEREMSDLEQFILSL